MILIFFSECKQMHIVILLCILSTIVYTYHMQTFPLSIAFKSVIMHWDSMDCYCILIESKHCCHQWQQCYQRNAIQSNSVQRNLSFRIIKFFFNGLRKASKKMCKFTFLLNSNNIFEIFVCKNRFFSCVY